MITPYDWQEGIGNRAQYIEGKLKHGAPVIAVSLDEGILIYTRRRQTPKIYEVYDRLAFAAIGQQSDVDALRAAAVEFAHQEGFNRSEQDVTIQRVVTALSASVKKAFGDFSTAPLVARSLFVEVNDSLDDDEFHILEYDGDYRTSAGSAIIAGSAGDLRDFDAELEGFDRALAPDKAVAVLSNMWNRVQSHDEDESPEADLTEEAMLCMRSSERVDRFRRINLGKQS